MSLRFGKIEKRGEHNAAYYLRYVYGEEKWEDGREKPIAAIYRETRSPWADCSNEVTTHYLVSWLWTDQVQDAVFPVLLNCHMFSDIGEGLNAAELGVRSDEVEKDYLQNYSEFQNDQMMEASDYARGAGAAAKAYVKRVWAEHQAKLKAEAAAHTEEPPVVFNNEDIFVNPRKDPPKILVGDEDMTLVELAAAIEDRIKGLQNALALASRNQRMEDGCEYLRPRLEKSLKELSALKQAVGFCLVGGSDE